MDYDKLNVTDALALIGELEHARRHAIRSAQYAEEDDQFHYILLASQCQKARRAAMRKYFPVDSKNWCLVKAAATMRQISYECFKDDVEMIKDIDSIVDSVMKVATGKDLSECASCIQDMEENNFEEEIK